MISNGYKTTFLNNKCKCSIFIFTDGNFFSFVDHSMERNLVTSAPWNGRKKIFFSSLHNRTRTAQDGEWREKPSMWCFFLLTVRNFSLSGVNWNVLETAEKGSRNARRSSHIQKSSILYKKSQNEIQSTRSTRHAHTNQHMLASKVLAFVVSILQGVLCV